MKKIVFLLVLALGFWATSSCKKIVDGCTDKTATNYNSDATVDDGSCSYIVVGDSYQGGTVAYLFVQGDPGYDATVIHGLIVAPLTYTLFSWGCDSTSIATSAAMGTGQANTTAIIAACSATGTAPRYCNDLIAGGYSDWYLPGKEELNRLYANKTAVGGFTSDYYWSSTQSDANHAWAQHFGTGSIASFKKDTTAKVRAVRSF